MKIGHVIEGRYRIVGELGRGGMGIVFEAVSLEDERPVALKCLLPNHVEKPNLLNRLRREAEALKRLSKCAHCVPIIEFNLQVPDPYIVMELIGGQSLERDLVHGPLTRDRAIHVAECVLEALRAAHREKIVHRDIKPANIMTHGQEVFVLDFGLASIIPASSTATRGHRSLQAGVITEAGTILGTRDYMAPEQRMGDPASRAIDIYAVGLLMYEMLTATPFLPTRGEGKTAPDPGSLCIFQDEPLQGFVARCLSRAPERRFPDASSALESLQEIAVQKPGDSFLWSSRPTLDCRFSSQCFICGRHHDHFILTTENRLCSNPDCRNGYWHGNPREPMVSLIPRASKSLASTLPHITGRDHDLLVRWAGPPESLPTIEATSPSTRVDVPWPYRRDFLREDCGLTCGNATCYRSENLEGWSTRTRKPAKIFLLDMASYYWSSTLKDPKSWAVVNLARQHGLRHLAAWTAGNAGLSLARMVHSANQFLEPEERMRTYLIFDPNAPNAMDIGVRAKLKGFGAELIEAHLSHPNEVYKPEDIKNQARVVGGHRQDSTWDDQFWDVTDGWEGVGILMYAFLFFQVLRDLQPDVVILPTGTGNLIVGALEGYRLLQREPGPDRRIDFFAVIPSGPNVFAKLDDKQNHGSQKNHDSRNDPIAPKIEGHYTPLLPCLDFARKRGHLTTLMVNRNEQRLALRVLQRVHGNPHRTNASEPSSLTAIAALPTVVSSLRESNKKPRILVVNSGYGLMSRAEGKYLLNE